jgi:hypothetical protein
LPTETPYPTPTETATDEPLRELEITPEPLETPTDLVDFVETPVVILETPPAEETPSD